MLKQLKIPVLGVVENMSYYPCPDTGKDHLIFGPSHAQELAKAVDTTLFVQLPIDSSIAELGDAGKIEEARQPKLQRILEVL
jgi:Mrp family chromosome partitioning ATPase